MYLSSNDGVNGVDVDDNSQNRQGNTPPITSYPSQSSSPSCPTLLVIDDNSNSNDSSLNTTDIPSNSILSNAQITAHIQVTPSSPLVTMENSNDTPEQQRRRNSSIAKLLGGQPLSNQQYEEIHQQILDDQSAQNITNNNDNKTDNGIPRSRSSITRTLLMHAEGNNNTSTKITNTCPLLTEYSKEVEFLIRRELDIDHSPSTLHRNTSTPSVFQNLNTVRNTPPVNVQSPLQSKLKRKRPNTKQTVSTTTTTTTTNKSSNTAPFSIRDPFELDSSAPSLVPPINSTPIHRPQHHQNDLFRFDTSHRHHHIRHHPHPHPHQTQQQYSLPMNNSTTNSSSFTCHRLNLNSPVYPQFKIHQDRLPTRSTCSCPAPSSYNCCHYPPTTELALPTPVSPLSPHTSSPSIIPYHTIGASSRKTKVMHNRPDIYEIPVQRSYSTMSNQSSVSSSSSSSSGYSIPLKKRLLHAYKNEQRPSSSL